MNPFIKAINIEQRRIQRLIDLSASEHTQMSESNHTRMHAGGSGQIEKSQRAMLYLDEYGAARGSLHLQRRGANRYGYERWQKKGQERSIYLGTLDSEPVRGLFSEKFKVQRLARLEHDQKLLQNLAQHYQPYDFSSIVADMPRSYQAVARANSFNERYEELRAWANAEYPRNTFPFPDSENFAVDGTRMRSKGECIFYNLMFERGILFRNDCEIEITDQQGNTKKLYPDFLIQCFDGTFIIIEHLGRMDDFGYAMGFGEKSYWYFQEGFILGKNYFVTSDDLYHGTDSQMIARVVDQVEEMFYGY